MGILNFKERRKQHGREAERREFARLVNEASAAAHLSEDDLCTIFAISLPVARRWKAGETMPQPRTRELIVAKLKQLRDARVAAHA